MQTLSWDQALELACEARDATTELSAPLGRMRLYCNASAHKDDYEDYNDII